ncbi:MAG: hypothetical protein D9N14_08715 [Ketobacter sp.]|nr:MAG: hypothetical protein D9N14_08715 [Ketobacter sp.]
MVIAHRLWTITQADSILVMRQGETVQVGGLVGECQIPNSRIFTVDKSLLNKESESWIYRNFRYLLLGYTEGSVIWSLDISKPSAFAR